MGLFGRIKKAVNRTVRKVENFGRRAAGGTNIGEKEPEDDLGTRAAAAKRLTNRTQQAGGGQISFNTEENVE